EGVKMAITSTVADNPQSAIRNPQSESERAVACRDLTREFGDGDAKVLALRGVDMEVYAGQMTLLVGPSGCGKTTLISIIAGLLAHEPKLVVGDGPTAALDARSGHTVMELLRRVAVQPGRAVIVVTHDNRVFGFGDRIIHMNDGRIERVETPARPAG